MRQFGRRPNRMPASEHGMRPEAEERSGRDATRPVVSRLLARYAAAERGARTAAGARRRALLHAVELCVDERQRALSHTLLSHTMQARGAFALLSLPQRQALLHRPHRTRLLAQCSSSRFARFYYRTTLQSIHLFLYIRHKTNSNFVS